MRRISGVSERLSTSQEEREYSRNRCTSVRGLIWRNRLRLSKPLLLKSQLHFPVVYIIVTDETPTTESRRYDRSLMYRENVPIVHPEDDRWQLHHWTSTARATYREDWLHTHKYLQKAERGLYLAGIHRNSIGNNKLISYRTERLYKVGIISTYWVGA
jgi:hypothetical protein